MKIVCERQLINDVFDYDVVLFGMGVNNSMNNGFSYDIALNFPIVREEENNTGYGDKRKYGTIHETIADNVVFCACYTYNIGMKRKKDSVYIDYEALKECLKLVKKKYRGKKIVSPIIGQDVYDGNGDKDKIISIYNEIFNDESDITLYDFVQQDFNAEIYKETIVVRKQLSDGIISRDEFNEIRRRIEWKRLNGIYKPIDENFSYVKKKKNMKKFG